MKLPFSILLTFGMLTASADGYAADIPAATPMHVGPVYTRGDEAARYPQYPELQIEVTVPPTSSPELMQPEAFHARADGKPAVKASRVQALDSTGYGVAASISLDVSGSMRGSPLNAIRSGLSQFVSEAGPADRIAIQTIADDSRWDADWEDSRDQVRAALDNLKTRGRLTRLWDGLLESIHHFPETPLSHRLIVISDGHDEGSVHSEDEVLAAAQERGTVVDAIGITRSDPRYLRGLEQLANQTGGLFRRAKDTEELQRLVSSGIERLKSTPVVSFRLDDLPADGKTHRFQVIWRHDGIESSSEVTALVPAIGSSTSRARWLWAGIILILIILLAAVILISVRRRQKRVRGLKPVSNAAFPEPDPASLPYPVPLTSNLITPSNSDRFKPRPVAVSQERLTAPVSSTRIMPRFAEPIKGRPAAWLICEEGPAAGEKFPLDEAEYWIGTLENNHLQIADDPTLSGNHACLVFDHDVLGIYDYQSTNGTRVNGELVRGTRRLLWPGDRIRVGRSTFVVLPAQKGLI